MRVIKENNVERQVKCKNCGSLIGYLGKDVHSFIYRTICCLVCKEIIHVSKYDKKVRRNYE